MAKQKNPQNALVRWNLAVKAVAPHLYPPANRPGRVIVKGVFGTHLGNNQFVTYDGRQVTPTLAAAASLTKNFKRLGSHGVREITKCVVLTDPGYLLDSAKRNGVVMHQILQYKFKKTSRLGKLTAQDCVDMFSVVSPAVLNSAGSRIANHDYDVEVAHTKEFWGRNGHVVDVTQPATVQAAYDGLAARRYANIAQTAIAFKVLANEIKATKLAQRCKLVAPTAELVKVNKNGVPTKKPVTRADATAVLKAV